MIDHPSTIHISLATALERDEIRAMQALSMRELAAPFYDADVIEAHITAGTMDDALIADGTYYVARIAGTIVGTGGWSTRQPGYASHLVDAVCAAPLPKATVRSIYVHSQAARRGIARAIMQLLEAEISDAGHRTAGLMATLSGIPLYRRLGWRGGAPTTLALPGGLSLVGLHMTKSLPNSRAVLCDVA